MSKSLHLLRGTASSKPLGATGNDEVNASQGNQASGGYLYLTLTGRQWHFIERCHLPTDHDIFHGAWGPTRHNLVKCGRHPKKSQVLAREGRGSLRMTPDAPGWPGSAPPPRWGTPWVLSRRLGGRPGTSWQSAVDTRNYHKCLNKWVGCPWGRSLMRGAPRCRGRSGAAGELKNLKS